jgi:hypothetical protein
MPDLLSINEQTCKQDHAKYQRVRYEQTSSLSARAECECFFWQMGEDMVRCYLCQYSGRYRSHFAAP